MIWAEILWEEFIEGIIFNLSQLVFTVEFPFKYISQVLNWI